jgi:flagellar basal body-associated protein FliL
MRFEKSGKERKMKTHNLRNILLMPIAVFLCCIGWSLYWVGAKKETTKPKPKLSVQKELVIFVPTPEQKCATRK